MNKKQVLLGLATSASLLIGCSNASTQESQVDSQAQTSSQDTTSQDVSSQQSSSEQVTKKLYHMTSDFRVEANDHSSEKSSLVFLTFDDAPDKHSLQIAQTLKAKGAHALFLVNGHFLDEEGKAVLKEIYDMGFEIGNHTQTHQDLATLSYEEQLKEVKETSDIVEQVTGQRPRFFRPPFGSYNDNTLNVMKEENLYLMTWTFGYDWQEDYQTSQALQQIMINAPELSNGANILLHDRSWTADAIGQIVDGYAEKGYISVDPKAIELPLVGESQ